MAIRKNTLTLSSRPEVRWTGNSHFVISTGVERSDILQEQISRLRTMSSARNDIQGQLCDISLAKLSTPARVNCLG